MSEDFTVLRDLQSHLRTAQVPFEQLSTLAQQGDDLLVERFLTENIRIQGSGPEVLQSQLYISCFWGMKEIVQQLLTRGVDINFQNKGTQWTPLHAAAFQEHGPVVMVLLENGATPEKPDSEGRTPKDFASASDKIWPHFAALGLERTPRWELVEKSVIKKVNQGVFGQDNHQRKSAIRMSSDSRPESAYAYNSDPFIHAAVTGMCSLTRTKKRSETLQTNHGFQCGGNRNHQNRVCCGTVHLIRTTKNCPCGLS